MLVSASILLAGLAAVLTVVHAAAIKPAPGKCDKLRVRKEWRDLTDGEKTSYLDAVVCVKGQPPAEPNPYAGVRSLFDSFQGEHSAQAMSVHWQAAFLPFHRLFLSVYEKALESCGYDGAQPYWHWPLDWAAGSLEANPMFDPKLGFGGNGVFVPRENRILSPSRLTSPFLPVRPPQTEAEQRAALTLGTGGGCVPDGRFSQPASNWTVSLGLGNSTEYQPHCLRRDFNFDNLASGNRSHYDECLDTPSYGQFHYCAERQLDGPAPHGSGHGAIGGEMQDVYSSPGDPLFYLHHAGLDHLWADWQKLDSPKRLHEIEGNAISFDFNSTLGNATVNSVINLGALHGDIKLGDLLDTTAPGLCYEYADPPSSA